MLPVSLTHRGFYTAEYSKFRVLNFERLLIYFQTFTWKSFSQLGNFSLSFEPYLLLKIAYTTTKIKRSCFPARFCIQRKKYFVYTCNKGKSRALFPTFTIKYLEDNFFSKILTHPSIRKLGVAVLNHVE